MQIAAAEVCKGGEGLEGDSGFEAGYVPAACIGNPETNRGLGCILTVQTGEGGILPLTCVQVRSHLESCTQLWDS